MPKMVVREPGQGTMGAEQKSIARTLCTTTHAQSPAFHIAGKHEHSIVYTGRHAETAAREGTWLPLVDGPILACLVLSASPVPSPGLL